MGREELIRDLHRKSGKRIKKLWQEAEARAAELRSARLKELEQLRAESVEGLEAVRERIATPMHHEADCAILAMEDAAMQQLAARLKTMLIERLPGLRQQDYAAVFAALAGEVPANRWEKVRVHPQDVELAGKYFPGAEIAADPGIIGGFIAEDAGNGCKVINTLEKRLERGWPAILPEVLQAVMEADDVEPAA